MKKTTETYQVGDPVWGVQKRGSTGKWPELRLTLGKVAAIKSRKSVIVEFEGGAQEERLVTAISRNPYPVICQITQPYNDDITATQRKIQDIQKSLRKIQDSLDTCELKRDVIIYDSLEYLAAKAVQVPMQVTEETPK